MKRKLNLLRFILVLMIIPLFALSCSDKGVNTIEEEPLPSPVAPIIGSISPESGEAGSVITITGNHFGTDISKVQVRFNTTNAEIILSVTDTEIKAKTPAGFSNRKVQVRVFVSNRFSDAVDFYYPEIVSPPKITAITGAVFYNGTIVLEGEHFSSDKEENIVKFGEIKGTVTEATSTRLTVIVPDMGTETTAAVTVTKLNFVSNAMSVPVDIDQNKVATFAWTTHTARPGVVYKTGSFALFGSTTRRIHVLDVTLDAINMLGIGVTASNVPSSFKNVVSLCNDYSAVAGINAGYFAIEGAVDKDPYIRIDGNTVQNGHLGVNSVFTNAALIIHDNIASIKKLGTTATNLNEIAAAIPVASARNIIVSGPTLIIDGVLETQTTSSHNTSSTARTGLGVSADGKRVWLVVVDYNQGAIGVSTTQLGKILQALGAVNAMNFDGGGSSTMFVQGQGNNGRVSTNGNSMRAVRSVIYVK